MKNTLCKRTRQNRAVGYKERTKFYQGNQREILLSKPRKKLLKQKEKTRRAKNVCKKGLPM